MAEIRRIRGSRLGATQTLDDLEAFGSDTDDPAAQQKLGEEHHLLVISQGMLTLAVEALHVESVVPWQTPALLPRTSPWVQGIIQDRGRLVAVRRTEQDTGHISRIVLCNTSRGLIGIPASETRSIGAVMLVGKLRYGLPLDSEQGALTILDPEALARQMTEE